MLVIPGSSQQPSHLKSKYLPLIYLMFKTFECSRDPLLRKLFGNTCSYIQFFVIFPPTSQWTVRVKESSPLMISAPSILVVSKSRFRFAAYYIKLVARNLSKSQCVYRTIPRNTTACQLRKKQVSFFGTNHARHERCLISQEEKEQLKVIWIAKLICSLDEI